MSISSDSAKAVHIIERERLRRREIDREMTRHWRYLECEIRIDQEIIARQANKVRAQELKILEHNDHSIKQKYSLTGLDHILEARMNSQTLTPREMDEIIEENRILKNQKNALQRELQDLQNSTSLTISGLKATVGKMEAELRDLRSRILGDGDWEFLLPRNDT